MPHPASCLTGLNVFLMYPPQILIRLGAAMRYTVCSNPDRRQRRSPAIGSVCVRSLLAYEIHSGRIPHF
jgi:hypothetical protein